MLGSLFLSAGVNVDNNKSPDSNDKRYVFRATEIPSVPIKDSEDWFPVRRIFCVGRNYAEHAKEMGADPSREAPFFFTKPADAIVIQNQDVRYPGATSNLHHEVEMVVAMGKGGKDISTNDALEHVFGYAVGNDLTRRDLQAVAKKNGRPWDTAKGFDQSAPISSITPADMCGHINQGEISLTVNGELRQIGDLSDMIWTVEEIISALSALFTLEPGDLIFTGTPAGVSALVANDRVEAKIAGLTLLQHRVVA